jgi:hypothetical protein
MLIKLRCHSNLIRRKFTESANVLKEFRECSVFIHSTLSTYETFYFVKICYVLPLNYHYLFYS